MRRQSWQDHRPSRRHGIPATSVSWIRCIFHCTTVGLGQRFSQGRTGGRPAVHGAARRGLSACHAAVRGGNRCRERIRQLGRRCAASRLARCRAFGSPRSDSTPRAGRRDEAAVGAAGRASSLPFGERDSAEPGCRRPRRMCGRSSASFVSEPFSGGPDVRPRSEDASRLHRPCRSSEARPWRNGAP